MEKTDIKHPRADDPEQSQRFIDMAREVEADETPGALNRALDKVIPPPTPSTPALSKRHPSRIKR